MKTIKAMFINWTAVMMIVIISSIGLLSSCKPTSTGNSQVGLLYLLIYLTGQDSHKSDELQVYGVLDSFNYDSNTLILFRNESGEIESTVTTNGLGEFSVTLPYGKYHMRTIFGSGTIYDETLIVKSTGIIEPDDPESMNGIEFYNERAFLLTSRKKTQTTNTYSLTTSIYDDDGNLIETKKYNGNSVLGDELLSTTTFTYNDMGRQVLSTFDDAVNDYLDSISEITYDENGRILVNSVYSGGLTKLTAQLESYTINNWDDNGNLIEQSYDSEYSTYLSCEYDDNAHKITQKKYENGSDPDTATLLYTTTVLYANDGYVSSISLDYKNNPDSSYIKTYEYDSSNNMILFNYYTRGSDVNTGILTNSYEYTYDENRNVVTILKLDYDDDGTVDRSKYYVNEYNSSNYLTRIDEFYGTDDTGSPDVVEKFSYDENNILTEYTYYSDPHLSQYYESNTYTIDSEGSRVEDLYTKSAIGSFKQYITTYTWTKR